MTDEHHDEKDSVEPAPPADAAVEPLAWDPSEATSAEDIARDTFGSKRIKAMRRRRAELLRSQE